MKQFILCLVLLISGCSFGEVFPSPDSTTNALNLIHGSGLCGKLVHEFPHTKGSLIKFKPMSCFPK